jgi:signal peptidase I
VKRRRLLDLGLIVVVAVAAALAVQAFIVKPYRIPSPSMASTLVNGDRILVNRLSYAFGQISRGDVVVFHWPKDEKLVFVKRVIGLPGDVLSLRDGHVFVNGKLLKEPYVLRDDGRPEPTLNADELAIAASDLPWGLERPYKVPAGCFFVMGDNRMESDDSRDWGVVPRRDVIGRAFMRYWPLERLHLL